MWKTILQAMSWACKFVFLWIRKSFVTENSIIDSGRSSFGHSYSRHPGYQKNTACTWTFKSETVALVRDFLYLNSENQLGHLSFAINCKEKNSYLETNLQLGSKAAQFGLLIIIIGRSQEQYQTVLRGLFILHSSVSQL